MEKRYEACMVLHAMGDTIGFNNGKWEFMPGGSEKVHEKVNQFVDYGGINYVPQKGWRISDDTIMHLKTAYSLLENYNSMNTLGKIFRKKYIEAFDEFNKEEPEKRAPGITLIKNLDKMKAGLKWNELEYDFYYGGSGAAMRSACIGLAYHGEENREKLIQVSIESSRITHNSTTGYLGGFTVALFTAFAIENIDIKKWPHLLVDLFRMEIPKYIRSANRDIQYFTEDHHHFLGKWKRYIDEKFDDEGNPIYKRSSKNLIWRTQYYHNTFSDKGPKDEFFPGSAGDDSTIIAYDCLLDSDFKWEKLVFYAMLHGGDTDTTGCIAGAWYGAIKEYGDVPIDLLDRIERYNEIKKVGRDLYKKYGG